MRCGRARQPSGYRRPPALWRGSGGAGHRSPRGRSADRGEAVKDEGAPGVVIVGIFPTSVVRWGDDAQALSRAL